MTATIFRTAATFVAALLVSSTFVGAAISAPGLI